MKNSEFEAYLKQARADKKSLAEMADAMGVSLVTVSRYLKKFGLAQPNNLSISVDQVVAMHESGMTGSEISKKLGISHDAVTRRLSKAGIKLDRADGIRKHFAHTYEERWPEAKRLLDEGMAFTNVAAAMHLRLENLRDMMSSHDYAAPKKFDVNLATVQLAFSEIIDKPGVNAKRKAAAQKYLDGYLSYVDKYESTPRATQLAQHMDIPVQTVSWWFEQAGLGHLLSVQRDSYLVAAVRNLLDGMGIRYELNRRDIIHPFEIDIWLRDFNTGIEVNPVTTHSVDSDWGKDNVYYHQKKSLLAISAGIGLAHIYDFDLVDKTRWESFKSWLQRVVNGEVESSQLVNLDIFLPGVVNHGVVSEPGCVWVNPNTHECRYDGDSDDLMANHFRRVFTAGFLDNRAL